MPLRDKIEHAIQNQPCTVKDLKAKFGGDRGADRKVMEALDQLVHEAVICQKQGVFFTVRSGRAEKALLCKVVKLGKNFAFVMLDDGTSDIFIPGRFTRGAMPGDMVLVEKFEHPRVEGSDEGAILAIVQDVLAKNEKAVADFKAGKNVTGFLVGQCMKASKGQGNPQIINKLIAAELAKL